MKAGDKLKTVDKIYSVEISGWDIERQFFVERTSLAVDQAGTRTTFLRSRLHQHLVVFIRLLSTTFAGKVYPKVYRVDLAELPDRTGFSRIHLTPAEAPRTIEYHATSGPSEHLSQQERKNRVKV
jgi:hypothetical protein